jgi:hypothetical protein
MGTHTYFPEDFPHIAEAERKAAVPAAPHTDQERGDAMIARTGLLALAALLAPMLAGAALGAMSPVGAAPAPTNDLREQPFGLAHAESAPATLAR